MALEVKKDPAMLEKILKLHAGIETDLRRKNTPSRAAIEALTHEQLAAQAKTTPTTLSRFLNKHEIRGDVFVGSRFAFSKALAEKISLAVFYSSQTLLCENCAWLVRDSSPDWAAKSDVLAAKFRHQYQEILAEIKAKQPLNP